MAVVKIRVCKSCAWDRKKIRRALKDVAKTYDDRVELRKKDCLDLCSKKPALEIDGRALAPASAKSLRRVIEARL